MLALADQAPSAIWLPAPPANHPTGGERRVSSPIGNKGATRWTGERQPPAVSQDAGSGLGAVEVSTVGPLSIWPA